jgi:hypothetical protein
MPVVERTPKTMLKTMTKKIVTGRWKMALRIFIGLDSFGLAKDDLTIAGAREIAMQSKEKGSDFRSPCF